MTQKLRLAALFLVNILPILRKTKSKRIFLLYLFLSFVLPSLSKPAWIALFYSVWSVWLFYAVYNHPGTNHYACYCNHVSPHALYGLVGDIGRTIARLFLLAAVVLIGYSELAVGDTVAIRLCMLLCLWPWASHFLPQLFSPAVLLCSIALIYLISLNFLVKLFGASRNGGVIVVSQF